MGNTDWMFHFADWFQVYKPPHPDGYLFFEGGELELFIYDQEFSPIQYKMVETSSKK
jgi:hypothetical protein